MARRKEKEEIVITMWGIETLQGKGGVYTLLRCDRKLWYSKVLAGNREARGVYGDGQMSVVRRGREPIPPTPAMPRNAEVAGGTPEQQVDTYERGNTTQGGTVNSAVEQRNLGALG